MKVDAEGKVRLFLLDSGKWADRWAVDARELLRVGAASVAGPVVEVKKGKKSQTVCEEQVEAMESDGWKRVAPPPADPVDPDAGKETKTGGSDKPPVKVDFNPFDEAKLGGWLASAVPSLVAADIAEMTKPQLIEQLERINFVLPSE